MDGLKSIRLILYLMFKWPMPSKSGKKTILPIFTKLSSVLTALPKNDYKRLKRTFFRFIIIIIISRLIGKFTVLSGLRGKFIELFMR